MTRRRSPKSKDTVTEAPWDALQKELERLRSDMRRRDARMQKAIEELRGSITGGPARDTDANSVSAESARYSASTRASAQGETSPRLNLFRRTLLRAMCYG